MSHIHINFEHVNYSYEKTVPILQDITFTAHENDSIGLSFSCAVNVMSCRIGTDFS